MSTAQLRREILRLREQERSRRRDIPADRVVFARELGIEPDPWQRELLRASAGRVLLNCSRQSGKSTVSAILALHRALYHPGSLVLILAPSERQAKETFRKVVHFYRELHYVPVPESDRKLGMLLDNASRIEALPGSERTVRCFSGVDLLILDEAARVDDALFYAIKPMLAVSGGALLMLSTPWGRRGVFFEEWARGSEAGWKRFEIRASECPRISCEFLEEERRSLPARIFRQEYECSFEDVEDQVFAYELVDRTISADVVPLFGNHTPRGATDPEEIMPLFGEDDRGL